MKPRDDSRTAGFVLAVYMTVFLVYLFLPLVVMVAAAFNSFPYPALTPWKGFTLEWFGKLAADDRMIGGLINSVLLGAGVTAVSVPLGVAGALVVARGAGKAAGLAYSLLVSPILIPGVVLGLSTLVFWRQVGIPGGLFVAGAAQVSFIASYCMLLVLARLARQDTSLEEAALGLGAGPWLLFRRVTLPYLAPSLAAAAVVAFLQSFENYNTTIFAVGGGYTLVTEIGSRLRFGLTPALNALGVIFIAFTLVTSFAFAVLSRRGKTA
jgi:spermidine/putrescine transport system permease protein